MKTTVDLPDDLVTEIKVEAARQHRKLKDLVPELLRSGLRWQRSTKLTEPADARAWLDAWVALGARETAGAPPGPTATQVLAADRDRP